MEWGSNYVMKTGYGKGSNLITMYISHVHMYSVSLDLSVMNKCFRVKCYSGGDTT